MEDEAVVFALARKLLDLLDVLGRHLGQHLDDDAAILEIDVERVLLVEGDGAARQAENRGEEHEGADDCAHGGRP